MDDLNRQAGICPFCGAEVEPNWALCDECGKRLPWAPPKQQKNINDLTDEELTARFAVNTNRGTPGWVTFLKTWPGKITVMVVSSLLWEICNRLFFHLY